MRTIMRQVYRMTGLAAYDAETEQTLREGCATSEREAVLRYGRDWREVYRSARVHERLRRWRTICSLFNDNAARQAGKGEG